MSGPVNSLPDTDYRSQLLTAEQATAKYFASRTTFDRFKKHHKIPRLTGNLYHEIDLIRGFERERGKFPPAKTHV